MHFIVYKTTNKINGKFYIGQHKTAYIEDEYIGSGSLLKRAIKKYGIENFETEVLELCQSKESLNEKEIYWIDKLNATNKNIAYNISKGGDGGDTFTLNPNKAKIVEKLKTKTKLFWDSLNEEGLKNQCQKMKVKKTINDISEFKSKKKYEMTTAWALGKFNKRNFKNEGNPMYVKLTDDIINSIKQDYENMILTKTEIFKKYGIGHTVFHRISKEFKHPPRCWWNSAKRIDNSLVGG